MPVMAYPYIETNGSGVPCISGSRTKVADIVLDHVTYGWDAAQIQAQHPHLSLAQIHSALAYYFDHKSQIDAEIETGRAQAAQLRKELGESPAAIKLRAAKSDLRGRST